MFESNTVSVIGLGKLGSPMAACFADKGYNVIGVDVNKNFVDCINKGIPPVYEPGLDEYLKKNTDRIFATTDYSDAIMKSFITFIIVPTPSDDKGGFSLRYASDVIQKIGNVLREKSQFHVVVLCSTVMPGSMKETVLPTLESSSEKKCSTDFGLCYNPEFVAIGNIFKNTLNPPFVLIGESDSTSGDILAQFHKNICDNNPPIARMNFMNAELTKLALNTFVTTKISFANMLAQLCEKLPGADVDTVTEALGNDSRIGHRYLKGGLAYGGPCFPRDNRALACLSERIGVDPTLARATDKVNKEQTNRLIQLIENNLPSGKKVGILGLSYKPNTDVTEESQGLLLVKELLSKNINVIIYDPRAKVSELEKLEGHLEFANSMEECIRKTSVLVITTPWDEFKNINPELCEDGQVILDGWRLLSPEKYRNIVKYIPLGRYEPG